MFIKLKRQAQQTFVSGRTQGFRMTITASDADGLPNEIFVFQRFPQIDANGQPVDGFVNIASPADLEETLVNAITDPTRPFYRLASVDLVFRNEDLLNEAWIGIQSDVNELIQSLKFMSRLAAAEEVSFGDQSSSSSA